MNGNITYYLRVLLSIVLITSVDTVIFCQHRSNPFEIKPRLGTGIQESESARDMDTIHIDNVTADTLSSVLVKDIEDKDNLLLNPFDVDHVPVRKSAIIKRAEKLQNQTNNTKHSNTFLIWFLLFSCVIIAITINLRSKTISFVSRSIFNENILKLFQREEQRGVNVYLILLYLSFLINISVLIYLISVKYGGQRGIITMLIILCGTTLVYILKHLGLYIIGRIFMIQKSTDLYRFTIMIFNHALGMILIPINFLIAFGPPEISKISLWIAIGVIGVLLILRTLRGIFIVFEYLNDRIFQIFVYLCAFEIAPMMILIKTIMNFS